MKSESVPQQTSNSGEMGRTSTKFCGIGILNGQFFTELVNLPIQ